LTKNYGDDRGSVIFKGRNPMPKTRAQKEEIVSELAEKLSRMKSTVFTSVSGYTMDDANALRTKGREQGVELLIAKKTLLVRALEKNGFTVGKDELNGSVLTTIGYDDEVAAAKLIAEFAKEREGIEIVGGLLEGQFVNSDAIKQLSSLPSREELLAKVVGSINAPISGFVNVLAGNLRNFVYVLNAIKEDKS
jgi:large subunit ribosomal protein L10